MKKILLCFISFSILFSLIACDTQGDKVLSSLGDYTRIAYYSDGEIQDFTDYAKYKMTSPSLDGNEYLKKLDDILLDSFIAHLDMYEPFVMEYCSFSESYDFDRGIISDSDYIYIYDDPEYPELGNFSIWFYDFESEILYYFHNNI